MSTSATAFFDPAQSSDARSEGVGATANARTPSPVGELSLDVSSSQGHFLDWSLDVKSPGADFFDGPSPAMSPCITEDNCHSVSISDSAYSMLCHLRRDGESDADVMVRGLFGLDAYRIAEKALKAHGVRKAYTAARHMRRRGFSDEAAIATIRAFFGSQTEKDLWHAFRLLDMDGSGFIDKDELWNALPFMGETLSEDQLDEVFYSVDADGSGLIDFEEFSILIRGLNPNFQDDGVTNALSELGKSTGGSIDAFGDVLGSAASSASSTVSALSTAWIADLPGLSGMEMRKVGSVMNNMRKAGYSEKMAKTICRALFCEQSETLLRKAFDFYDSDKNGILDAVEFRNAMPLMGEDVRPGKIDELFSKLGIDESGHIQFEDFCKLVKGMNPKRKRRESDPISIVSDAWSRVQRTWAAKTKGLQDEASRPRRSNASNPSRPSLSNASASSHSTIPNGRSSGSEPSKKSSRNDSAGSGKAAGTQKNGSGKTVSSPNNGSSRRSSGNALVLPPKSQRVSVAKQPVSASSSTG